MNKILVKICKIIISLFIICGASLLILFGVIEDLNESSLLSAIGIMFIVSAVLTLVSLLTLFILEMRIKIKKENYKAILKLLGSILFISLVLFLLDYFILHNELAFYKYLIIAITLNISSEGFHYMKRK